MQKYKQYCPVARAAEIFADRWTPLIVREVIAGSHRFNQIERGLPGISRSLLSSRLRDLEAAGVLARVDRAGMNTSEYQLTEAGRELKTVVEALGAWGVRWAFGDPRPEDLDSGLLIWKIHQRIDRDQLPASRTVVEFDFTGPGGRRVWLLLEAREVSVCVTPPRFDSDVIVHADLAFFYRLWLGHVEWEDGLRCGAMRIDGSPALTNALPRWLMWSPMARLVRTRKASPPRTESSDRSGREERAAGADPSDADAG